MNMEAKVMSDTYCGKSCTDCSYREELNCHGCKLGPGRDMSNECDLASCCRMKGHKTCDTCEIKPRCGKYINKSKAPKERIEKNKADNARKESLVTLAELLSDKVKILFWILILTNVFSILSGVILSEDSVVSIIVECILSAFYGIVLILISKADRKFFISGILLIVSNFISITANFVMDGSRGTVIFVSIIASVIGLVAEYNEFMGHSDVVMAYDGNMSEKWFKIWYWYLFAVIGSIIGLFIGTIVLIIAAIAILILGILKIIYIYQTAEIYRQYYWFNE